MPVSVLEKVCIQPGDCPQQLCLTVFVVVDIFFSFVIMAKAIVIRLEAVCCDAYMI